MTRDLIEEALLCNSTQPRELRVGTLDEYADPRAPGLGNWSGVATLPNGLLVACDDASHEVAVVRIHSARPNVQGLGSSYSPPFLHVVFKTLDVVGGFGCGPYQFANPKKVCVAIGSSSSDSPAGSDTTVLVADWGNRRIQQLKFIGTAAAGVLEFEKVILLGDRPCGIACMDDIVAVGIIPFSVSSPDAGSGPCLVKLLSISKGVPLREFFDVPVLRASLFSPHLTEVLGIRFLRFDKTSPFSRHCFSLLLADRADVYVCDFSTLGPESSRVTLRRIHVHSSDVWANCTDVELFPAPNTQCVIASSFSFNRKFMEPGVIAFQDDGVPKAFSAASTKLRVWFDTVVFSGARALATIEPVVVPLEAEEKPEAWRCMVFAGSHGIRLVPLKDFRFKELASTSSLSLTYSDEPSSTKKRCDVG